MKHSVGQWKAIKNSSWGEEHKSRFNDREGYVICCQKNGQTVALASVIGMFGETQEIIDGNAKLLANANKFYYALKQIEDSPFPRNQQEQEAWCKTVRELIFKTVNEFEP